jgi:hypothetical protein
VDCGVGRNPVHPPELVDTQSQSHLGRWIYLRERPRHRAGEKMVQKDVTSTRRNVSRETIREMPGMDATNDIFRLQAGYITLLGLMHKDPSNRIYPDQEVSLEEISGIVQSLTPQDLTSVVKDMINIHKDPKHGTQKKNSEVKTKQLYSKKRNFLIEKEPSLRAKN